MSASERGGPRHARRRRWATAVVVLLAGGFGWWVGGGTLRDWLRDNGPEWTERGPSRGQMKAVRARLAASLRASGFTPRSPALLRVIKSERKLEVWLRKGPRFERFRSYAICSFSGDLGPKQREGDLQAPEGFYSVSRRQLHPGSAYHLAMNVGYPNAYDRAHGRTGSAIMVHGSCVSIGCFAMTDAGIEEIYALVEDALVGGQRAVPLHIFPFRMTPGALAARGDVPERAFWAELEPGWQAFERTRRPPRVRVRQGRYVVSSVGSVSVASCGMLPASRCQQ